MSDAPANAMTALEGLLTASEDSIKLEAAQTILAEVDRDRRMTLMEDQAKNEANGKEIDRLAQFLMDEFPQTIGHLGAVDTAIALIKNLHDQARNHSTD